MSKSPKIPDSKWVYFVYLSGAPCACFSNSVVTLEFCRMFNDKMSDFSIVRYAPAVGLYRCRKQDITETFKRCLENG